MEKTYTITKPRSLYDICLEVYGDTQYKYKLCKDNGLSVDFDLRANYFEPEEIKIKTLVYDDEVGNFLVRDKHEKN